MTDEQDRLNKIEEKLEAVIDQVGKLSEEMTEVKQDIKALKEKLENEANE